MSHNDGLHRFFCEQPLIAAVCTHCGKLAAVYRGHHIDCPDTDDEGWRPEGRCRCDPPPPLPARGEMAAQIAKACTGERVFLHRAPVKIYI